MGGEHPGDRAGDRCLEILDESAAAAEPSEGPLDHPSARKHFEAVGALGTPDDRDGPLPVLAQCLAELVAGIAAIGKDVTQPGIKRANGRQDTDGAVAVLDIGGMNLQTHKMALGVGDNVTLAPLDFLAGIKAIKAGWAAAFRGLHRLAVDHAGGRLASRPACARAAIPAHD